MDPLGRNRSENTVPDGSSHHVAALFEHLRIFQQPGHDTDYGVKTTRHNTNFKFIN